MSLDGTFGGLKASVADFLNRSDLASAIPDFVTMATSALTRRLLSTGPVLDMMGDLSLTVSSEYTNLPSDFRGLKSIYVDGLSDQPRVQFAEPEKIDEQKMLRRSQDGDPQLFTIIGNKRIQFWPAPTSTLTLTVRYWQKLAALSGDSDTNWLLTDHPDAYLYTALVQSAPYLKDDSRITTWGELAVTAVQDIVAADKIVRLSTQQAAPYLPYDPP